MSMSQEQAVWSGSPSQMINLPAYILCFLLCWLVVPIFIGIWKWLVLKNTRYELTTERLKLRTGVLNKNINDVELYRVRDFQLAQPFFLRMFSLSHITLQTSDKTNPVVVLRAIENGEQVRDQIRHFVEACRMNKRVREVDLD